MTEAPERPLETGWLSDTPAEDTVLRAFILNQGAHNASFADACGGRSARTDDVLLADSGTPVAYLSQAILTRPLTGTDDSVLSDVDEFFAGRGGMTLLSIWPTPDLSALGWSLIGHPAVVLRSPGPVPEHSREGVDVRIASTADDLLTAERVAIEGYPLDEAKDSPAGSVFSAAIAQSGITVRVGYVDGEPVGVGNVFVHSGLVNLALGATLPAARRRGVWQALVWERVAEAPDLPTIAYTSDDSRPGFVRMGFLPITRFTLWMR